MKIFSTSFTQLNFGAHSGTILFYVGIFLLLKLMMQCDYILLINSYPYRYHSSILLFFRILLMSIPSIHLLIKIYTELYATV